jgi:two-component system response regulator YesN
MMKIIIADDESLARALLKNILQELNLPPECMQEAVDGEQMIEQVKHYTPELVFVDIQMPRLNGLDAIRKAKTCSPYTRWVILTGFSEFRYAHEAIKLGVSDYLLKPVDPEEVQKLVDDAIRGNKEQLLTLNRQFESKIADLYHGLSSLQQADQESFLLKAHFAGAIFCLDSSLIDSAKSERQRDFLQAMQTSLDNTAARACLKALFALPSGEIALVGAWESTRDNTGKQLFSTCSRLMNDTCQQFNDKDFCITMLQAGNCSSYEELQQKLNWLQRFSLLRTICGIRKTLYIAELAQYETQPDLVEMGHILMDISNHYRNKMYLNFMKDLDTLEGKLHKNEKFDHHTKTCIADFLNHTISCQLEIHQNIVSWKKILQACGEQLLIDYQKKDKRDIVDQVIAFVDENYMFDIGIGQIALQLHVTPNHLSSTFHKKMGLTFMKYLTSIRMLRAKELLADPKLPIQEVAEQVGYYSSRHFTKTFTDFFGYYPSDYRKKSMQPAASPQQKTRPQKNILQELKLPLESTEESR